MQLNVGPADRVIRMLIGVFCVYITIFNPLNFNSSVLLTFIGLFAAINLFTALFSFCPLYHIAGISTRKE